ncbi:MAG: xanthine dehydrogenase family protein molybdopterin-binding subunit, partial [Planctomycetales bacterium]|nr:xanthine dehydrogenase family protein molybdopterin-binding subunit [Planctomycetales bacterium]
YDKTQWVDNVQQQVAAAFGLAVDDVRVISPFVGGAFGSALRAWVHVFTSAMAAKQVRRPVKLVLSRAQQYTVPGYRPHTVQTVSLAANKDGRLTAIRHEATGKTSTYEQFTETVVNPSRYLYECPNVLTRYRLAPMNYNTPASMRAPGIATGAFALECALDELAVELKMDPLELRMRNYAEQNPEKELPWSSKSLKECYQQAADKFEWHKRLPEPGSMKDGRWLLGWGMATATWPTHRKEATVLVRILTDGTAQVRTAASDIGPGTYTVMTQIAADALGLPVERVHFDLGDTKMPQAPVEGGSMTVASVGSAVHQAALAARRRLFELARGNEDSPLFRADEEEVDVSGGRLFLKSQAARGETFADILKRNKKVSLEVTQQAEPGKEQEQYSMHAFGAQFVEVCVDPDFGTIRIRRVVSGFAAGRIINPKTARSQAIGGVVMGLGMALLEEVTHDQRNGRVVNADLEKYMVPVNADIPHLDVFYVDEEDHHVNPIGAKGLAELSVVGVASAVANAVYHATGKRVRELPILPEKLI